MNKNKINKKQFLKTLCVVPFIGDILIDKVDSEEVYKSDFTKSDFTRGDCGWNNFNDLKCFSQQDFEKLTQQIKEINSKYGHNL